MTDSGSETIYSESEVSEDESLHSSDEDFNDDSEHETSESEDEVYLPPKKKVRKIQIFIKNLKNRKNN